MMDTWNFGQARINGSVRLSKPIRARGVRYELALENERTSREGFAGVLKFSTANI